MISGVKLDDWKVASWIRGEFGGHPSACNLICLLFDHFPFFILVLSCVLVINGIVSFNSFTFNNLLLVLGDTESTPISLEGLTS